MLNDQLIQDQNKPLLEQTQQDYDALGSSLATKGIAIEPILKKVATYTIAIPSWGVGTGGTRFARFPGPGEPRDVFDKLDDCGVINQLTRTTPRVSLHIPWDKAAPPDLKQRAKENGLSFDAMNSNTFEDSAGQTMQGNVSGPSYKYGSLSHTDAVTRAKAIDHNLECIEIGKSIGSKALTVWVGDGSNFPGQANLTKQFERYLDSIKKIYAQLPPDWRLFTEHKMYEPAFYATVVADWGSNYFIARELGPQAQCLVDLGHHAQSANIEMIVARLIQFGKLGGFHFNDSKYGDDDLDTGCIDPYRLFLIFNELVDAQYRQVPGFNPAHMLDQSHNMTDPIESLMTSAMEVQRAYALALLVDREALTHYQETNDALMASQTLKRAFHTDVEPLLALARIQNGGAIDPVKTFRASGYRDQVATARPIAQASGGGIIAN